MTITMTGRSGERIAGWGGDAGATNLNAVLQVSGILPGSWKSRRPAQRLLRRAGLLLAVLSLPVAPACALESLDDGVLAATTGQDGLNLDIKLPGDTLIVSQVGLVDTNGITNNGAPGTHVNGVSFGSAASLVYSPLTYSATKGGISLCTQGGITDDAQSSSCTATTGALRLTLDSGASSASGSNATLNLGIALPAGASKLRVHPFSLSMATGSGNIYASPRTLGGATPALRAGVTEVLRMGGSYTNRIGGTTYAPSVAGMEVVFGGVPTAALQLGNEVQGHMLMFTGGSISRISNYVWNDSDYSIFTPLQIMSKNGAGQDSQIATFFDISGALTLSGFYMDVGSGGLVFGKVGATPKVNAVLAKLQLGGSGAVASDGLLNQEMFFEAGVRGLQMNDLKVTISALP